VALLARPQALGVAALVCVRAFRGYTLRRHGAAFLALLALLAVFAFFGDFPLYRVDAERRCLPGTSIEENK
jgi:hypothetical protein